MSHVHNTSVEPRLASLAHSTHIRHTARQVLALLGAALQFEVAVGLNGAVWVAAPTPGVTVLVAHALRESRGKSDAQCTLMVEGLLARVQGG